MLKCSFGHTHSVMEMRGRHVEVHILSLKNGIESNFWRFGLSAAWPCMATCCCCMVISRAVRIAVFSIATSQWMGSSKEMPRVRRYRHDYPLWPTEKSTVSFCCAGLSLGRTASTNAGLEFVVAPEESALQTMSSVAMLPVTNTVDPTRIFQLFLELFTFIRAQHSLAAASLLPRSVRRWLAAVRLMDLMSPVHTPAGML